MELLEYLADKVGCTYMSDLRFLPLRVPNKTEKQSKQQQV